MGQTTRLGIDVACRADHQASCADGAGEFLWSGCRFRTTVADLQRLWAKLYAGAEVTVVLEPTRKCLGAPGRVAAGPGGEDGDGAARAVG